MNLKRIAAIAAVAIFPVLAFAELPQLLKDSATLDRAYIPALMLSNSKDPAKAKAAQQAYESAWKAFAEKHRATRPGDAAWTKMFATIDKANTEANAAIAAGKLTDAHEAQEEVRHELWHQRQVLGLDYQPDRLTDFHATMELLIAAVQGKDAAAVGAKQVADMKPLLAKARGQWQHVKSASFSPAEYGLDGARLESYRAALGAEDKALDELSAALDAADGARIVKAAPAIKPPFAKAYAAFGEFPK